MQPRPKHAGIAGVLAGVALIGEFVFFMASGFTPDKMNDPAAAMIFLRESSEYLRLAVFFGATGVAVRTLFIAGLAARLAAATPSRAVATLYFGLLGGVGHGLVALSFYIGFPMFVALALHDHTVATNAWGAFVAVTSGFQGFGNFLLGLMLLVSGWAIISEKALPMGLGWIGAAGGSAALIGVFTSGTPLANVGFLVFMPSIILAIVFDIWGGFSLWRSDTGPASSLSSKKQGPS